MSLQVVPYTDAHWPGLQSFLSGQYPDCAVKADASFFRWKFAGHPLGSSLPGYWLALDDDRVIGQFGIQTDQLVIDGRPHLAGSCVDLKIAADSGHASALWSLFESAMAQHPLLYTIGPNPQLTPVFRRLGWREMAPTQTRYRIFRPGRALAVTNSEGRLARLRPWLALTDPLLPAVWRVGALLAGGRRGYRVEPLDHFGDEIDALFTRLLPQLGITTGRSGAIWTWRFGERPLGRHRAVAVRSADGELRGCAVVRLMQRPGVATWAEVADLLVDPGETVAVHHLMQAATRLALQAGVDFLRLRSGWPELERTMDGPLWLQRPGPSIWAYAQDPGLMARLSQGPWTLTGAAGDALETGRDEWGV